MAIISSHTLNGIDGTHASGVPLVLRHCSSRDVLLETNTDDGGRLLQELDAILFVKNDRYELTFETGIYWASKGYNSLSVIPEIVLRFILVDPNGKYHLPVIFSPYSFSTWTSGK